MRIKIKIPNLKQPKPLTLVSILVLGFLASIALISLPAKAATGINKQINFQGKVVNANGTNVTDGAYNFDFKIYTVASGGAAIWSELSKSTTVTSGVFQTSLGSATTLPGSIDFNTDNIYLGITFNGDAAGEMTPRVQFSAVPQAFNSEKVGGILASGLVQLTPSGQQTGTINISGSLTSASTLQGTSATLTGGNSLTLGTASSLTGAIILNNATNTNTVTLQSGVSGSSYTLTMPTTAPSVSQCLQSDSVTASQLKFGSCAGGSTTLQNAYDAASGNIITTSNAKDVTFTLADTATDSNFIVNVATGSTSKFAIQQNGSDVLSVSATGAVLSKNSANSATAFQIQNSSGANVARVDTSGANANNLVTNPSFENNSTTGWTGNGGCTLTAVTSATTGPFNGQYSGQCSNTATIGAEYRFVTGALTASTAYTFNFYAKASATSGAFLSFGHVENGGAEDVAGLSLTTQAVSTSGWTRYSLSFKTGATLASGDYLYVKQTDATARSVWLDGATLQTDANGDGNYREGKIALGGIITSPTLLQNESNSTTAFQVQNAAGASVFTIDTTDSNLLPNPGAEVSAAGWSAKGSGTIIRDSSQQKFGIAAFKVVTTATANDGAQYAGLNLAIGTYSIGVSIKNNATAFGAGALQVGITNTGGDNVCTLAPAVSATIPTSTGWTRFTCSVTIATTVGTAFYVKQTEAVAHTIWVDGIELDSGATLTPYGVGSLSFNAVIKTPLTLLNQSDSTSALAVYNAAGLQLLGVDTLNAGVNIATGAVAGTVTIGNTTGASAVTIQGGTGAINIGTQAIADTITIGNSTGATSVVINNGTGALNLGTNAIAHTVTIGNTTGASALTLQAGTGNVSITGAAATTFTIGPAAGTGAITVGPSTASQTINIGNTAKGAGSANTINIGATNNASTGTTAIAIGSSNTSTGVTTVTIKAGTTATSAGPSVTLGATASTTAVCSSLAAATAPTAGTAYELRDCSGTPAADFAENYPVASGVEYGDVVAIGTKMINTYDVTNGNIDWTKIKGRITQLVKSSQGYQSGALGIVSENQSDFTTAGYNIKSGDNPKTVALVGRVPVKVTTENGAIEPGDFLASSDTRPGYAMKATGAGYIIGQALEAFTDAKPGKVMVFARSGYSPGPNPSQNLQHGSFGDLISKGTLTASNIKVSGLLEVQDIVVNGHFITAGGQPTALLLGSAGVGANISISGTDTIGTISITTGTKTTPGELAKIVFSKSYTQPPKVLLSPSNEAASKAQFYRGTTGKADFTLNLSSQASAKTNYKFDYFIGQ